MVAAQPAAYLGTSPIPSRDGSGPYLSRRRLRHIAQVRSQTDHNQTLGSDHRRCFRVDLGGGLCAHGLIENGPTVQLAQSLEPPDGIDLVEISTEDGPVDPVILHTTLLQSGQVVALEPTLIV